MGRSITPVILCGGSGTRLWPLSTPAQPKPFHVIEGGETLFQATIRRLAPGPDAPFNAPVIICAAAHRDLVRAQLRAIGVRAARIVVELAGRGTAMAAALAAQAVGEIAPDSAMLLAPADHHIKDPDAFRSAVAQAADASGRHVVLFAVPPERPETGYGYIRVGTELETGVRAVEGFVEKPGRDRARALVADGGWAWNAGLFLATPRLMTAEIKRHAPDVWAAASAAWRTATRRGVEAWTGWTQPLETASQSLDRAVIEHTRRLAVTACDVAWADVGCWKSLWTAGRRDPDENRLEGPATVMDSSGCLVWSSTVPVAVIGMTDVVVVTTADGVLVMPRDRAQDVGRLRVAG